MTREQRLQVYELALKDYEDGINHSLFVCRTLNHIANTVFKLYIFYNLSVDFPEFYLTKPLDKLSVQGWWSAKDVESRINALKIAIQQTKSIINNEQKTNNHVE